MSDIWQDRERGEELNFSNQQARGFKIHAHQAELMTPWMTTQLGHVGTFDEVRHDFVSTHHASVSAFQERLIADVAMERGAAAWQVEGIRREVKAEWDRVEPTAIAMVDAKPGSPAPTRSRQPQFGAAAPA
ncbi:MAG TPA: ATPase inhibitor subunit zeta [Alphaproteobacteria bacterium]|nr:ATPase inhibitor subunit zeta [Alphaproteobacteria bacterium]